MIKTIKIMPDYGYYPLWWEKPNQVGNRPLGRIEGVGSRERVSSGEVLTISEQEMILF